MSANFEERYSLRQLLGAGGTSDVYRAWDEVLSREVAIKLFRESRGDRETAAQVLKLLSKEAQTASTLHHPNIVAAFAAGVSGAGRPYIVMEMADGNSLSALLSTEGPLPLLKAVDIAHQLARAVEHMHHNGLIHRDIKPSNVMISRGTDGGLRVKLIDMGLSKYLTLSLTRTQTAPGTLVGSPSYMSPEQCLGLPADERSDIFAIGTVLYEALSARQAFPADNAIGGLLAAVNTDPPPLTSVSTNLLLPAAVENVVFRALAKNPADRYQSVAAMAGDLESIGVALRSGSQMPVVDSPVVRSVFPQSARAVPHYANRRLTALMAGIAVVSGSLAFGYAQIPAFKQQLEAITQRFRPAPVSSSSEFLRQARLLPENAPAAVPLLNSALVMDEFDKKLTQEDVDDIARRVIATANKSGWSKPLADVVYQLALDDCQRSHFKAAGEHAELARHVTAQVSGDKSTDMMQVLSLQSQIDMAADKLTDKTIARLTNAREIASAAKQEVQLRFITFELARAYLKSGDAVKAHGYYEQCVRFAADEFADAPLYRFRVFSAYANLFDSEGNKEKARHYIVQAMQSLLAIPVFLQWADLSSPLYTYLALTVNDGEASLALNRQLVEFLNNLGKGVSGESHVHLLLTVARLQSTYDPSGAAGVFDAAQTLANNTPMSARAVIDAGILQSKVLCLSKYLSSGQRVEYAKQAFRLVQADSEHASTSALIVADQLIAADRYKEALVWYDRSIDLSQQRLNQLIGAEKAPAAPGGQPAQQAQQTQQMQQTQQAQQALNLRTKTVECLLTAAAAATKHSDKANAGRYLDQVALLLQQPVVARDVRQRELESARAALKK